MNFENPLTADFQKDSTQEVKPYVKLGNMIIKADWDYPKFYIVCTWENMEDNDWTYIILSDGDIIMHQTIFIKTEKD